MRLHDGGAHRHQPVDVPAYTRAATLTVNSAVEAADANADVGVTLSACGHGHLRTGRPGPAMINSFLSSAQHIYHDHELVSEV